MESNSLDEKKKAKRDQLKNSASPLVKLLNEEYHPHCTAIVTPNGVEVLEGVASIQITEFTVD